MIFRQEKKWKEKSSVRRWQFSLLFLEPHHPSFALNRIQKIFWFSASLQWIYFRSQLPSWKTSVFISLPKSIGLKLKFSLCVKPKSLYVTWEISTGKVRENEKKKKIILSSDGHKFTARWIINVCPESSFSCSCRASDFAVQCMRVALSDIPLESSPRF